MSHVELLSVADTFQLSGIGLTLMPDSPVPPTGWKSVSVPVVVITPEGNRLEPVAQFNTMHFNIRDPSASAERRWRVVVTFPTLRRNEVPVGSKVLVLPETKNALLRSEA